MKALIIVMLLVATVASAGPAPHRADAALLATAVPGARAVRATCAGYAIDTAAGTRMAYKTPDGYIIPGAGARAGIAVHRTDSGVAVVGGSSVQSIHRVTAAATEAGYNVQNRGGDNTRIIKTSNGYTAIPSDGHGGATLQRVGDGLLIHTNGAH